ncbi:MAG: hypothetical protein AAF138_05850 [Planctomycetota bacterium]
MADEARRVELPTEEELDVLPIWAAAAYAIRCARRVQPFYSIGMPDWRQTDLDDLDRMLDLAEQICNDPDVADLDEFDRSAEVLGRDDVNLSTHVQAYKAVRDALRFRSSPSWIAFPSEFLFTYAAGAAENSVWDVGNFLGFESEAERIAIAAARRDFDLLARWAFEERWEPTSPVDMMRLGPLWPSEKLTGWLENTGSSTPRPVLKLEFDFPSDLSDAESEEVDRRIVDFLAALSGAHAAMGGSGLKILDQNSVSPALASDPQPSGVGS